MANKIRNLENEDVRVIPCADPKKGKIAEYYRLEELVIIIVMMTSVSKNKDGELSKSSPCLKTEKPL